MNTTQLRFASNRMRDIERRMHQELDQYYPAEEVSAMIALLVEAYLGWDRTQWLLHRDSTVNQSDMLRFHWAMEALRDYRPIQYIIGSTSFCGCHIDVDERVLIPRPETAEMVDNLITLRGAVPAQSVLDLCTGSGCIAIALASNLPQSRVTAVDISADALQLAARNAAVNGVSVTFLCDDVLAGAKQVGGRYDLIVSNPPYVRESERQAMSRNVLDYEPSLALFVPDDDALCFYAAIASVALRCLSPDGLLAVEINESLADETCAIIMERGLLPVVHVDFQGRARWITAAHAQR